MSSDGQHRAYKSLYGFSSTRETDLDFEEDTIIFDIVQDDKFWWTGSIVKNGAPLRGRFPRAFVAVAPQQYKINKSKVQKNTLGSNTIQKNQIQQEQGRVDREAGDVVAVEYKPAIPARNRVVKAPPPVDQTNDVYRRKTTGQVKIPPPPPPRNGGQYNENGVARPPPLPARRQLDVARPEAIQYNTGKVPPPPPPRKEELHRIQNKVNQYNNSSNQHKIPPPPPPRKPTAPAIVGKETKRIVIDRTYSDTISKPPEGMWYQPGDHYTCRASIQQNTLQYKKTKAEYYTITKQDRSKVELQIIQDSNSKKAVLEYTIQYYQPVGDAMLIQYAKLYGPQVLAFIEKRENTKVGDGECWTLANEAIKHVGLQQVIGYNFGQVIIQYNTEGNTISEKNTIQYNTVKKYNSTINHDRVMPGDVIQFTSCVFKTDRMVKTVGFPNHTAIVLNCIEGGKKIQVYEQNPNPVQKSWYDFDTITQGSYVVYRPVPNV